MAYKRKTEDSWQIWVNYGGKWEHECTERTAKDARATRKEYRENCPEYPVKIKKKRELAGFWDGDRESEAEAKRVQLNRE